jgi:hypothetical protein
MLVLPPEPCFVVKGEFDGINEFDVRFLPGVNRLAHNTEASQFTRRQRKSGQKKALQGLVAFTRI